MLTLLGSLLGFGTSIFPSIMEYFQDAKDKKHELQSMELQMKLMDKQTELNIREAEVSGQLSNMALELKAEIASVKAAHSNDGPSGSKFIDGLRGSVRPIITYWFMGLYTFSKHTIYQGVSGKAWQQVGEAMFTEYDLALFATILSFWFGDRIRKYLNANRK